MGKWNNKWTKTTAGLIFLAAGSVYTDREIAASVRNAANLTDSVKTVVAVNVGKASQNNAKNTLAFARPIESAPKIIAAPAEPTTDVKLIDEATDPFAAPASSASTTQPSAAATTQPAGEGKSVSAQEVSVSDAGTVEIHVNDANLVEVLRMLSLQSQKNIIASKDVHGTVTANLYDVTVREALDAILHANGYAYREKGNFIYVYTSKELEDITKSERQMKTEVIRLYYTPASNASVMIKPVLSATGQVAVTTPATVGLSSGGGGGGGGAGGGGGGGGGNSHSTEDMLVVTDYPENIDAVKRVLAEVDARPQQILLEATILRASLNEDNALGIDFTILGGVDFAGLNTAGSGAGEVLSGAIANNAGGQGVVKNNAAAGQTGFTNGVPSGGLRVGVVTSNVAAFLQALEQTTDTTVLANPKVLTLNKQQGEVFVGNEDGFYTTVTTETTTSQQVETLKTGTRLLFRPYIANDGFIRLEVHPEDSDGQVKANGLPSKTTTEVTSNIMVKDGHTIVIGGLFRESTVSTRSQVPFLGNLPLAGLLFRNQRDATKRDEVIILLTPHVVKDQSAYTAVSEQELRHVEDMRVGLRKGMMPWGRTRLAESAYEAAKKELTKPNPDTHLAIWHLNEATNLNPEFTDAIELKQQLTGKVVSEASGSSIRSFLTRAMLRDSGPTTSPSTRPSADVSVMEAPEQKPTTMPVAALPATMPSVRHTTTQPSQETAMGEGKTGSADDEMAEASKEDQSTESEAVAQAPETQPAGREDSEDSAVTETSAAPSTQPVVKSDKADDTTVTELPLESATGEADIDAQ